ncbi:MAG: protein arginine kinase activator [Candidatus Atribacteria bacterium]|nr:protein arginine kinase activator [Candidatus Atribacteria bacterium]
MKCDFCHQEDARLIVYLMDEVGSCQSRFFLCSTCAEKIAFSHLIKTESLTPASYGEPALSGQEAIPSFQCSFCQTTLDNFLRTGYLGCPKCYQVFSDRVQDFLANCQPGSFHTGAVPSNWLKRKKLKRGIEKLEQDLSRCLREENYEKADQIKRLINKLKSNEK